MGEKVGTIRRCNDDTYYVLFLCTKKNRKLEGNAYVNFCTRLQLVSNLQISEIARQFEIGELVNNLVGKFELANSLIYYKSGIIETDHSKQVQNRLRIDSEQT
jgi:hypothetical protein